MSKEETKTSIEAACPTESALLCCVMPKELTAENGAKALLIGEFHEKVERQCEYCWGQGNFVDEITEEVVEDCEECNGTGTYIEKVPVSWTTIKEIYAKAVERLAT